MTAHEQRMEGLVSLLNRARVIQEMIYWRQVYRQTHPLPTYQPSFAYAWLTRRTANRPVAKVKAAA